MATPVVHERTILLECQLISIAELDVTVIAVEGARTSSGTAADEALGHAARSWAADHGTDLPTPDRHIEHNTTRSTISIEIDL